MIPGSVLVLASGNRGKLRELGELFAPLDIELRPQSDWRIGEVEETGRTFIENALIKARHAALHCAHPALADDSGLVVPALDGAPGIFSARFAGPGAGDADNNACLLDRMRGLAGADRGAFFYCAVVLLRSPADPAPLVATARWPGRVLEAPRGSGGFGYDPLFLVDGLDRTSAELPAAEKNHLSHRGQAVRALLHALSVAGETNHA